MTDRAVRRPEQAVVDKITHWLGDVEGNRAASMPRDPDLMAMDDNRVPGELTNQAHGDDPETDPVGTVRVWRSGPEPREDSGLAIRWSSLIDRDEPYPWLILGSEGPQKLSHDTVRDGARVGLAPPGSATPRLQVLHLPDRKFVLVFDNVATGLQAALAADEVRDDLRRTTGATAVLVFENAIDVL